MKNEKKRNPKAEKYAIIIGIACVTITIMCYYPLLGIAVGGLFAMVSFVGKNSEEGNKKERWTKEDEEFMEEERKHEVYESWR